MSFWNFRKKSEYKNDDAKIKERQERIGKELCTALNDAINKVNKENSVKLSLEQHQDVNGIYLIYIIIPKQEKVKVKRIILTITINLKNTSKQLYASSGINYFSKPENKLEDFKEIVCDFVKNYNNRKSIAA